jgi:hypothetical protein
MVHISKVVGVLSCSFLLCLGVTGNAASAADKMKADQSSERVGGQAGLESEEGKLKGLTGESPEQLGGQAGLQSEEGKLNGAIVDHGKTIQGEVLRVEGPNYVVRGQDGKEVRLHTDSTTRMMTGIIGKGDRVVAQVNEQSHALSIDNISTQ